MDIGIGIAQGVWVARKKQRIAFDAHASLCFVSFRRDGRTVEFNPSDRQLADVAEIQTDAVRIGGSRDDVDWAFGLRRNPAKKYDKR